MFEQAFAAIEREVEGFEIPVDRVALLDSIALFDRLEARILDGIGAFDGDEGWRDDGATSMTAWLRAHAGRSQRDAGRLAQTAKRLHQLPALADAYRDGRLSLGQVQAIVVIISDKAVDLFAEAADELVPTLAGLSVGDVSKAMQTWAQAARDALQPDPAEDPEPPVPERSLHLSRTLDGRRELSGSLDPESGALADTAFRLAATHDVEGEPARTPARTPAERRADAFTDILRYFLDHQNTTPDGSRHRPHLNVFLDHDDLLTATNAHPSDPDGNGAGGAWPMGSAGAAPSGSGIGGAWPMGPARAGATAGRTAPCAGTSTTRAGAGKTPANGTASPMGSSAPVLDARHDGPAVASCRDGAAGSRKRRQSSGGWLADGTQLDPTTIGRLACDCGIHRVLRDGRSSVLDYGREVRTAPPNLFNALVARDRTCRFPGCDRPAHWADAHHVEWWEKGGRTSIRNLVLLAHGTTTSSTSPDGTPGCCPTPRS